MNKYNILNEFLAQLPKTEYKLYIELAEYALSLGYVPKKTKTRLFALDFTKNKVKKTIMKLELHQYSKDTNGPGFRLKFYASQEYSDIFKEGIRKVIEEFGGRYTGCYGCGRCKGELEGYTYVYDDGKKVFRCGGELIPIQGLGMEHLPEIKALLKKQDDFFMSGNKPQ